jgi:hypothetical protein
LAKVAVKSGVGRVFVELRLVANVVLDLEAGLEPGSLLLGLDQVRRDAGVDREAKIEGLESIVPARRLEKGREVVREEVIVTQQPLEVGGGVGDLSGLSATRIVAEELRADLILTTAKAQLGACRERDAPRVSAHEETTGVERELGRVFAGRVFHLGLGGEAAGSGDFGRSFGGGRIAGRRALGDGRSLCERAGREQRGRGDGEREARAECEVRHAEDPLVLRD